MRAVAAALWFLVLVLVPQCGEAQKAASASEAKAERAFRAAAGDPLALRALLVRMPKGGDLHMHLSGSVYAETFLEEAREDLMCVDPALKSLAANVGATRPGTTQPVCGEGRRRVEEAFADQALYDSLLDWFSMRSFVPSAGVSGHDQFFATFARFDPTNSAGTRHGGEWLDEIVTRAAAQNEQYVEIMHTPDLGRAIAAAQAVTWPTEPRVIAAYDQDVTGTSERELAAARKALLATPDFDRALQADEAEFTKILADRREREHCGGAEARPGCDVDVRFLFQVLRANGPALTFAQTLLGFEMVEREADAAGPGADGMAAAPRVVGINFVQPEDGRLAMAEYTRQMRMIGYLHGLYPKVHISLHAGELAEGLVPPQGLRFHIRQAIEIAHAERIGHGVDVMGEDGAEALLQEMAARHVLAEINLTSNDVILGVTGVWHPLPRYRGAGVPVALSTDDEGVSRIDLTHEYVRASLEFHLGYGALKAMARASLEHSFLPGASLWKAPDAFGAMVAVCASPRAADRRPGSADGRPGDACAAYLRANPRAAEQWKMERRLRSFEASLP